MGGRLLREEDRSEDFSEDFSAGFSAGFSTAELFTAPWEGDFLSSALGEEEAVVEAAGVATGLGAGVAEAGLRLMVNESSGGPGVLKVDVELEPGGP